ncbi:anaerobic sulfatase maturase [Vibrio sp. vnigr-6D03]|uniref:anaerobic sulfatase maturase n=1 Tax=Vibrio sp. vnigr-6D03 TaxID=2058088 RepID=UPI000C3432F2|nr:anaerobic sulfatase maturase [Vibrio sp. vnigr-6D03]PKF81111.1 anaerobic sulfatase maturase [Vibrio sp. vnigr-6D03]
MNVLSTAIKSPHPLRIETHKPKAARPFHVLSKPIGPLCNLDCEYCFYLDKTEYYPGQNRFDMTDTALETHVKNYIDSQPLGCKEVVFGWQGGEPTMRGIEFFERAVAFQKKHSRKGMIISNTIQTNGVLIDERWACFLKENDFLVGVSLDGDEVLHDHFRKTRSGKGSYKQVVHGLKTLLKYGVETNVLTVVQSDNAQHPQRVYEHITSLGVQFIQFIPVVEAEKGTGISHRSVSAEQFGCFMIEVFEVWRKRDLGRVFVSHFDNALGMELGMPSTNCVHSPQCGENLVMEHNGDVYSCDHFVYPEFKLGNLNRRDYPDLIETPVQQSFAKRKPVGTALHCVNCSQRDLCYGACPAQRIDEVGELSITAKHRLCEGYFAFFSHIRPYLKAMGACLKRGWSPVHYVRFLLSDKRTS